MAKTAVGDKSPGNTVASADFNQLLDAIEQGTKDLFPRGLIVKEISTPATTELATNEGIFYAKEFGGVTHPYFRTQNGGDYRLTQDTDTNTNTGLILGSAPSVAMTPNSVVYVPVNIYQRGSNLGLASESEVQTPMPAITVTKFRLRADRLNLSAAETTTWTIRKNGLDTALTLFFDSSDTVPVVKTVSGSVSFSDGDLISLEIDHTGNNDSQIINWTVEYTSF